MKKKAVFPGSFDPFTNGHKDIVNRALPLFDEIVIAIGYNVNKKGFFEIEKRKGWIHDIYRDEQKITVGVFDSLTVDFCKKINASYILRGLRSAVDFEYELKMAQVNKAIHNPIETVFLLTAPEFSSITSSIVRDIIRYNGDVSQFIPPEVNI